MESQYEDSLLDPRFANSGLLSCMKQTRREKDVLDRRLLRELRAGALPHPA